MSMLTEQLRDMGEVPEPATGESVETATAVHAPEPPLNSREFFKTYIPRSRDFVTIEIATIIIGFLITQPMELRPRRWLKIGASMALVYWGLLTLEVPVRVEITQRQDSILAFLGYVLPAAFLAAIWTGDICYFTTKIAMNLIDSPETSGPPVSPHRSARLAANQGDWGDALRFVKSKRVEDHSNYETLVLKAKLHQQMNHRWRAKRTLKRALRKPDLTDSQRRHLEYLLSSVDDRTNTCWKI
jgi:hypothetical protein